MKSFKIISTNTGYMLIAKVNGKVKCCEYPSYPANAINVLLNIGYTESI